MKISLNWLKEFVNIPENISPEDLNQSLTVKTMEIEGLERQGKYLENVVVGEVVKIENHPNADKLKICFVDIGESENLKIVCGGNNLREGMLTAVAKIGAKVKWHGGEEAMIEKTKVRGEESNGMICTAVELGMEEIIKQSDEREIIDLDKWTESGKSSEKIPLPPFKKGEKLADVLGLDDVILEVDNKTITHRPDLWGHYGIAREVAAIYNLQFPISNNEENEITAKEKGDEIKIEVDVRDHELCPRYMAVAIKNIKIGPSPRWMQQRLSAVGMRPINNIVDITNYVMLELGQPLHAFDKSKIKNQKSKIEIVVRRAGMIGRDAINRVSTKEATAETFKTLDGIERELDENMLVIADEEKPIAIAGVMGGENSEIDENTEAIIIESANFDKVNNRKTAAKLGLRTEACMRYEKGLDPNLTETALLRCVELIKEIIPGAYIASKIVDKKNFSLNQGPIEVSLDYINKKIGVDVPEEKVVKILESLGFGLKKVKHGHDGAGYFKITVPTWRATGDVSIPEDIVEEVARIYGYDDITPRMPKDEITPPRENKERNFERKIKNILSVGAGMAEVKNYSFVNEKQLENLGIRLDNALRLINPISSDQTLLRPSLIPNLLENMRNNARYYDELAVYEIGSVYKDEKGNIPAKISNFKLQISNDDSEFLPWQEKFVAGILVTDKNKTSFFEMKKIMEELFAGLNIGNYEFTSARTEQVEEWQHPTRTANIIVDGRLLGYATELNPLLSETFDLKGKRAGIFNLALKELLALTNEQKSYREILKYPSVIRDLAMVVDKKISYKELAESIKGTDALITSVELFDIYESEKLGRDKKSMAFRIIMQSPERTLTDEEIEKVMGKIMERLSGIGAEIRK